jgi:hypothetical protein
MKRPGIIKAVCSFYWFHAFVHAVIGAVIVLTLFLMPTRWPDPHFVLGCALVALAMLSAVYLTLAGSRLWRLRAGALDLARAGSGVLLVVNLAALVVALYAVYEPLLPCYALAVHVLSLGATSHRKTKAAIRASLREGSARGQPTRRWKRWLGAVGAVLLVLVPVLLGLLLREALRKPGAVLATRAPLRELEAARSRWAARPFSRYRLTVDSTLLKRPCRQEVEVRDEEVVAVLENVCLNDAAWDTPPAVAVTDLFQSIESSIVRRTCGPNGCRCDGVVYVDVAYDDRLGYPLHIRPFLKGDWATVPTFSPGGPCTILGTEFRETRMTVDPLLDDPP